jgi:hypothetical protein
MVRLYTDVLGCPSRTTAEADKFPSNTELSGQSGREPAGGCRVRADKFVKSSSFRSFQVFDSGEFRWPIDPV